MTLTDDELILLDGKCRPEIQREVDGAKTRLAMSAAMPDANAADAGFIADAISAAQTNGQLILSATRLRACRLCDRKGTYRKFPRRTRYHKAGDLDYKHPIDLSGYELARRFISVKGYASLGCCADCWTRIKPLLAEKLDGVEAEITSRITDYPPRFKRYDKMVCTKCDWHGHEGQMRQLRTLMGDGNYAGGCPNCPAENRFLDGGNIKHDDGWVVVPVAVSVAA